MTEGTQGINPGGLLKWRQKVKSLGFTDFVSPEDGFRALELPSGNNKKDLVSWNNADATGVYCWFTENGEAYVGKAKAVRRRLLDHWKVHKDILLAGFRKVEERKLDEVESDCVRELNAEYSVRNVKYALRTSAYVPFDAYLNEKDRKSFLFGEFIWEKQIWRPLQFLKSSKEPNLGVLQSKITNSKYCLL